MIYTFYTAKILPKLVGDQFAHEVAVGLARRERAVPAVVVEQFVGVREIEVSGEEDGMAEFASLVDERMAKRHLVFPEGSVTQVAEENAFFVAKRIRALRNRP